MLDNTVGGLTANSYVSVIEADAYMNTRVGANNWIDLDIIQKEAYLLTAMRQLELVLWNGLKKSNAQLLNFPRTSLYDYNNVLITDIPTKLKEAQLELAFWILTEEDRYLTDTDLTQLDSIKLGPMDLKVNKKPTVFPELVNQLLNGIGPNAVQRLPGPINTAIRFVI